MNSLPITGGTTTNYAHPYSSTHHSLSANMSTLSPNHFNGQQQGNSHLMPVQNGPVILVSNLNEDVSPHKDNEREREGFL